jgi:hypothetical protein
MGEVLLRKLKGRDHFEDPGVDGRIILRFFFRKRDEGMDWIDLSEIGTSGGNEPSFSMKSWEFLPYLRCC